MACRVIAISRCLAAGGEETGRAVAEKLGFRYADEEIIFRAAEKAGVAPESVAEAERTPGLVTRILEAMAATPMNAEGWSAPAELLAPRSPGYEKLIEDVVREIAAEGNIVIVAHGASIPLAGTNGLLRVLVTASPDARATRLARESSIGEREARKAVQESDRQRREFLRRFYGVQQELPTHYDLTVNTDVLTPAQAASLIVSAAKG